jgi:hypothetical protein
MDDDEGLGLLATVHVRSEDHCSIVIPSYRLDAGTTIARILKVTFGRQVILCTLDRFPFPKVSAWTQITK